MATANSSARQEVVVLAVIVFIESLSLLLFICTAATLRIVRGYLIGRKQYRRRLTVTFDGDCNLRGATKRLEDLHRLLRIRQCLAVDVLDQVARPEPQRGELPAVTPGIDPVTLLLPIDEIGRRPNHVREASRIVGHDRLDAVGGRRPSRCSLSGSRSPGAWPGCLLVLLRQVQGCEAAVLVQNDPVCIDGVQPRSGGYGVADAEDLVVATAQ